MRRLLIFGGIVVLGIIAVLVLHRESYRLRYGRPLLTTQEYFDSIHKVNEGMTFEEVRNAIGDPHTKEDGVDGNKTWYYFVPSSFSPLIDGFFGINFDAEGRMTLYWIP